MYSTTALGQALDSQSLSAGGHGIRGSLAYANWTRAEPGYADIMVNDNQALGDYMTSSDFLCDATDDTDGDLVADNDGLRRIPVPVPFNEVTTDVAAAGESYLLSKAGVFPMTARFGSTITNVWLFGTVARPSHSHPGQHSHVARALVDADRHKPDLDRRPRREAVRADVHRQLGEHGRLPNGNSSQDDGLLDSPRCDDQHTADKG